MKFPLSPSVECQGVECGAATGPAMSHPSFFKVSAFPSSEHALRQQRTNQYLLIQSIKQGRKQEEGGRVYCLLIRDMTRLRSSFLDTGYRIFLHFVTC